MDLIVGSTWIVLGMYSLVANVLLIVSIATSARMRSTPSFWIIASHGACDMGMSIMTFIHAIPSIFLHELYFEYESLFNITMLLFYDIFWYTEVVHLSVMAINRYICIVHPSCYAKCFSWRMTIYILFLSYMLGIAVSLPTQFPCCYILWDSYDYFAKYVGPGGWYKYVDMVINTVTLTVMVFCYTVILIKIRRTRNESKLLDRSYSLTRKMNLRLFVQFSALSVIYLLTWSTCQWLPHLNTSRWSYFFMSTLFFITNAVNPTVYLIFNSLVRERLSSLMGRKQRRVSIVTTKS